jgi:hypothetical protein
MTRHRPDNGTRVRNSPAASGPRVRAPRGTRSAFPAPGPGRDLEVPQGDSGIAVATYRVPPPTHLKPPREFGLVGTLVGGVAHDGEGGIVLGGHYHPIGPWDPFLGALSVFNAVKALQPEARAAVQIEATRAIASEANHVEQQLRSGGEAEG